MITTIIIISLAFTWLLYETDFLRIRLPEYTNKIKEVYMTLPSGAAITKQDYDYLVSIIKPTKSKKPDNEQCWYCNNGHNKAHFELGLLSYDLCECGATTVPHPKKKAHKSLFPYAKLATEVGARFTPYHQANLRKMKALI